MPSNVFGPHRHAAAHMLPAVREEVGWPTVVLVSNRGPIEHHAERDTIVARRGSGGVIAALSALAGRAEGTWVAAALTEGDRLVAGCRLKPSDGRTMGARFVALHPDVARRHYLHFSNPLLWFLHHDLSGALIRPPTTAAMIEDWLEGYVPANRALADAAIAEALALTARGAAPPVVAVHDYQLYLVPRFVRAALSAIPIHFFVHIPWPEPSAWRLLPGPMVQAICESLLACDVVGFQTRASANRFVETCLDVLPDASNVGDGLLTWWGRTALVASYPISVDVHLLRRQAHTPAAAAHRRRLSAGWTGKTIVRVDRVDPTKNLLRGFAAYDRLLRRRPDWRGQVRLLAFLVPSRSTIPEYRTYTEAVMAAIEAINVAHGTADWQPVRVFYENDYEQALAGMAVADVLFVNPAADGMNLVAKEGVVVNERDAVLVLSETAGAYDELGPAAVGVPPADVGASALALEEALTMPPVERRQRADWLRAQVERNDVHRWLARRYADLARVHALTGLHRRYREAPFESSLPPMGDLSADLYSPVRK